MLSLSTIEMSPSWLCSGNKSQTWLYLISFPLIVFISKIWIKTTRNMQLKPDHAAEEESEGIIWSQKHKYKIVYCHSGL